MIKNGMNRRDDMIAALLCRHQNAVPIWELSFHLWDAFSGRHVVLGEEFANLGDIEKERALETNEEIMVSVCHDLGFAGLTLPGEYWYQAPGELAYYILPDEYRLRQVQVLRELAQGSLLLIAGTGGVLAANYSDDFCYSLIHEPEVIDEMAKDCLKAATGTAARFRDVGIDVVVTSSDIADNSGPFFRPAQMRRFILPYLDSWASRCAEMGLLSILHTDGQMTPHLAEIADTAVNALQALDPVAGMDMISAKEIVGDRLCLCGNIDCGLLLTASPEAGYAATQALLTGMRGKNGWALGASNAVQNEVPIANYRVMISAWREFSSTNGC
jgi:uroporphyrinogen decarboxylase